MSNSKSNKGQQTREQLIDAAFRQFTQQGFHGASMRQIAEETGLALGGIYNHFASKDEMFKAVVLAYHPLNLIIPSLLAAQGQDVEALLRDTVQRLYTALKARPEFLNILFIELVECQGRHLPELMGTLLPNVLHFASRLAAQGEDLFPFPPIVIIRILMGNLIGFFLTETLLTRGAMSTNTMSTNTMSTNTMSTNTMSTNTMSTSSPTSAALSPLAQIDIGDLDTFIDTLLHGLLRRQS